jgi:hypothetical protein
LAGTNTDPPSLSRAWEGKVRAYEEKRADLGLESNVAEIEKNTCPYYYNGLECPRGDKCPYPHDESNPHDSEAIEYPRTLEVDPRCVYPLYYKSAEGLLPLATSVRTCGGFLTTRHTFFEGNGSKLLMQLSLIQIYDPETQTYCDIESIYDAPPNDENWVGCEWDYCKFITSPELMARSMKFAAVPAPFDPSLADVRMVQWSWKLMVSQIVSSPSRANVFNKQLLQYNGINTEVGNSGSPVFDRQGRLVAIHKKCRPNSGIIFSPGGKMAAWFLSQTALKNYQSPCINL